MGCPSGRLIAREDRGTKSSKIDIVYTGSGHRERNTYPTLYQEVFVLHYMGFD